MFIPPASPSEVNAFLDDLYLLCLRHDVVLGYRSFLLHWTDFRDLSVCDTGALCRAADGTRSSVPPIALASATRQPVPSPAFSQ